MEKLKFRMSSFQEDSIQSPFEWNVTLNAYISNSSIVLKTVHVYDCYDEEEAFRVALPLIFPPEES